MIGYLFVADVVFSAIAIIVLLLSPLSEQVASRLSLVGLCSAAIASPLGMMMIYLWGRYPETRGAYQDTAAGVVFTLSVLGFTLGAGSLRRSRRRLLSAGGMVLGTLGVCVAFFMPLIGRVH